MFGCKFSVTLLILAAVVKSNNASPIDELQNATFSAINKFLEETTTAVQDASQTGIKLVEDLENAIQSVIDNIKGQAKDTMNQVKQNIRAAVSESGGVVGKISNCTEQYDKELSDFQSKLINDDVGCVSEIISTAKSSLVNIINSTADISKIAFTANKKIDSSCPKPNSQDFFGFFGYSVCVTYTVTGLSSEVARNVATITINAATVSSIAARLSNLPLDITTCLATRTGLALLTTAPLVGKIVQCTLTP